MWGSFFFGMSDQIPFIKYYHNHIVVFLIVNCFANLQEDYFYLPFIFGAIKLQFMMRFVIFSGVLIVASLKF